LYQYPNSGGCEKCHCRQVDDQGRWLLGESINHGGVKSWGGSDIDFAFDNQHDHTVPVLNRDGNQITRRH
jgi:hypothetical protein